MLEAKPGKEAEVESFLRGALPIVQKEYDPRVLWPDTMSLAMNGYLYFTANQLHRQ